MISPSVRLAASICGALYAQGVRDVVYCPGSRSAPFAYVLDALTKRGYLRSHIRVDERSAGFLALGLSRGAEVQGKNPAPVAIVTTSGTAVTELHASIAEASHAKIPLLVLSADRPFEMRGVGASQTTDQVGVFASHVRGNWDIPAGSDEVASLPAIVGRALACAQGKPTGEAGPVHINVGLRDPLTPTSFCEDSEWVADVVCDYADEAARRTPTVHAAVPVPVSWNSVIVPELRTVIVAGEGADKQVGEWASRARVPLIAEPSVPRSEFVLPYEQSLLSRSQLMEGIEQVIVTGRPTLSRVVQGLLAKKGVRVIVQSPSGPWTDVAGCAAHVVAALAGPEEPHSDHAWYDLWWKVAHDEGARIRDVLAQEPADSSAVQVARHVWESVSGVLVLGASNSVRAVDLVARGGGPRLVITNRGLAGIDGTLATACGVAIASGECVSALMGDLTFFHDAGALAVPHGEYVPDVRIFVVDDGGGSIFSTLEHGAAPVELFDRWFRTRLDVSVKGLCEAYGADYRCVSVEDIPAVCQAPWRGIQVVHIPVHHVPEVYKRIRG
ncbi:2-succinyl-5-enolpyruvyl-6-hydroxy-3-cyclohexene-1-carboxylic-acid synthase [Schaalia sp. lx-100]|uniref:2-succinyl-5-enolpyruvyl-6-hydroxy-3- cyclohexene-1-carboxylic-acid synthase n=1 Tax=Schaalia sp. lx-100 TaxID=2899081 RepID=UPI001E407878|nr:2-succinyl-5-enolpyruvyl-6-hydroxy-3-cyclohexene-1-carboxylic-acid synthase [Schaalia sp. lx-100]MCD4557296.1 2-succinyl-5-enolpyruvyl-6-hydroxy-3-cyclohexene-1-carboxylic-acid synthase [Schaalia sp. lx-100]